MDSYNWFPGSDGKGEGTIISFPVRNYIFITDINGWTEPLNNKNLPDGSYLGPIILPPTWPNPVKLVRCRVIIQDGSGELTIWLDRGAQYYNTGKPPGAESGNSCETVTLYHTFFNALFTEKWDLPNPVLFDRTKDKLVVILDATTPLSWLNIEFSYSS